MKLKLLLVLVFFSSYALSQTDSLRLSQKRLKVSDTITVEPFSIRPVDFKVTTLSGEVIDASNYTIDFPTSKLQFLKQMV